MKFDTWKCLYKCRVHAIHGDTTFIQLKSKLHAVDIEMTSLPFIHDKLHVIFDTDDQMLHRSIAIYEIERRSRSHVPGQLWHCNGLNTVIRVSVRQAKAVPKCFLTEKISRMMEAKGVSGNKLNEWLLFGENVKPTVLSIHYPPQDKQLYHVEIFTSHVVLINNMAA